MLPGTKLRAYLAAPLFNDMEREFNSAIEGLLAPYVDVFLPQRDGKLLKKLIAAGRPILEARALVFQQDVNAIANADILIAILDGRTVDEGVAFELGYARALGKSCIGLKTDDRAMLPTGDNPMIVAGCHQICTDRRELVAAVRSHISHIKSRSVA